MPVQTRQPSNSGSIAFISMILVVSLLTIIISMTGLATPADAANITPTTVATTVITTKATIAPTVSPTKIITAAPTATTVTTTAPTSIPTSVQTTVATTATTIPTTTTTTVSVTTVNTTTTTAIPTTSVNTTIPTTSPTSVQVQPVAGFFSDIDTGPAPLTVQFTDLSSGGPVSWSWSFGDGGTDTVQNPSHTYENSGSYTVTLTATNPEGTTYTSTRSDYITVDDLVTVTETVTVTTETTLAAVQNTLTAGFSGTPVTGAGPLEVSFTDTSTGSPTSWAWDFGDGSQSTQENPLHVYSVPGSYTVTLTVADSGGTNVKSLTNYISVTGESTPFPTETSGSAIRNDNTGAIQKPITTYPTISRTQPTPVATLADQTGQAGVLGYILIIVVIVVIVMVAVVLYFRHSDYDELG